MPQNNQSKNEWKNGGKQRKQTNINMYDHFDEFRDDLDDIDEAEPNGNNT